MEKCIKYTLGSEAIEYIKNILSDSHTLAKYLLESLDLGAGIVITFLPPGLSKKEITDFEAGVMPMPPESEWRYFNYEDGRTVRVMPVTVLDRDMILLIQNFLEEDAERLCIFENWLFHPSDSVVSQFKSRLLFFESEVYHVLFGGHVEVSRIKETIKEAHSIPIFIGALTSMSGMSAAFQRKKSLSSDQIKMLAAQTQKIIVGAYDGEGYLIWNKSR